VPITAPTFHDVETSDYYEEDQMKAMFRISLAVTVLGILLAASVGSAQEDRAKALVGKWEGTIEWAAGVGSSSLGDPNRTLIIESVQQKDGKWVATGKYGVTGKGFGKVEIAIADSGDRTEIAFTTSANWAVRLALAGPKQLTGTTTLPSTMGRVTQARGMDRPMKLEKKD
jgi:hypothetical protein